MLNRQVLEFERASAEGTHNLSGAGETYAPSSELEAEAQTHLLGGGSHTLGGSGPAAFNDSPAERRRKILEATMNRLRKEEEELEQQCGTATGTGTAAMP